MIKICEYDSCTGCGVCANACAKNAIRMVTGELGEIRPAVNPDICVECGRCQKVCPANNKPLANVPCKVYAAWRNAADKQVRKFSASGGVAAVFSEQFINAGGVVCGVRYNERCEPVFALAETLEDIEYFKGSKYVQAAPGDIYQQIKKLLKAKRSVLFIGVSCQVAGLINFVSAQEREYLTTVDLLCHGVSPSSYLDEHITRLKKKYHFTDVTNVTFRTNIKKRNFCLTLWDKSGEELYHKTAYEDNYFRGFLTGTTLRESCYTCQYKGVERIADITIGDFIGLGEKVEFDFHEKQVSLVLPNTEKGMALIRSCADSLNLVERTLEEALEKGTSLKHPFPKSAQREKFLRKYKKYGFNAAADRVFWWDIFCCQSKRYLMWVRGKLLG